MAGAGLTYAVDYFRGLRQEMGAVGMLLDLAGYLLDERRRAELATVPLLRKLADDVRADHRALLAHDAKYGAHTMSGVFSRDVVQKIGLQMMVAIRTMRFFRDAGVLTGAKVVSRLIRHAYGSDVQWDAVFEPGVIIYHGFGIAMAAHAHVAEGCVLAHGVTIGHGNDPETGAAGTPRLERNVHVGPGATLVGPITIGEGTKIQAGALVTCSVPPRSLVVAPLPEVRPRATRIPGPSARAS
jgi:serine O-acetyltransferase